MTVTERAVQKRMREKINHDSQYRHHRQLFLGFAPNDEHCTTCTQCLASVPTMHGLPQQPPTPASVAAPPDKPGPSAGPPASESAMRPH